MSCTPRQSCSELGYVWLRAVVTAASTAASTATSTAATPMKP